MKRTLLSILLLTFLSAVGVAHPRPASAAQTWAAFQQAGAKAMDEENYEKAVSLFSAALAEAQASGNQEHAAQSILGVAAALVDDGKYEEAHKVLAKAVDICHLRSPVTHKTRGLLRTMLSHAHHGLGQHDHAVSEASLALSHLEQDVHADEEIVGTLSHLADLKSAKGDHHEAEALASHAVQLGSQSTAVGADTKAKAHATHARALANNGNHAEAATAIEKAKSHASVKDTDLHAALDEFLGSLKTQATNPSASKK